MAALLGTSAAQGQAALGGHPSDHEKDSSRGGDVGGGGIGGSAPAARVRGAEGARGTDGLGDWGRAAGMLGVCGCGGVCDWVEKMSACCACGDLRGVLSCAGIPKPRLEDQGEEQGCEGDAMNLGNEQGWAAFPVLMHGEERGTRGRVDEITAQLDHMLADRGPQVEDGPVLID